MTIKDLAQKSGYSVATVSRALNNHPNISAKAKAEIGRLAELYNFQINSNAQQLKRHANSILVIVKGTANEMFGEMTDAIAADTVRMLFHVRIEQKVEREEVAKVTGTNKDDSLVKQPKKREDKKVYPNDPCPCGSGKKYKQCCGRK